MNKENEEPYQKFHIDKKKVTGKMVLLRFFEKLRSNPQFLRYISPTIQIITVIIAIFLALVKTLTPLEATMIAVLFLVLENVIILTVTRENTYPILKEINEKHILLRHEEVSLSDWILREEYTHIVNDFSKKVSNLASGYFTLNLDDVPDLSLKVIESLKDEGFASVVVGETDQFFDTDAGKEYLSKCYDAAKRVPGTFTRLFIVRDFVDITPRLYDIIENHVKEQIKVLVTTRDELAENGINPLCDIGIWDRHCLMELKAKPETLSAKLDLQVGGPKVDVAFKKCLKMSRIAKTWEQFKDELCKPVNESEWADLLPKFQSFPAPAGPSLNDVIKMWELACDSGSRPRNVLVIGYTQKIVEYFVEQGCQKVDVLDIGVFHPRRRIPNASFFQGNWLTWTKPEGYYYDVVVGDDVLSNLGVWQYHIFFRRMSTFLQSSGTLIMRVTCQCGKKPNSPFGFQTTLDELKESIPVKEDFLIAKLWPMFHSSEFYNPRRKSFDLRDWNRRLKQAEPNAFSKTGGDMTTLRLDYPLELTSLPLSEILQYASRWFDLVEQQPVDKSYTDFSPEFTDFYRFLSFVRTEEPTETN